MCPFDQGFKTPLDSTVIWRYMTLSKFERVVQSSALWFQLPARSLIHSRVKKPRPKPTLGIDCGINSGCPRSNARLSVVSQIGTANGLS